MTLFLFFLFLKCWSIRLVLLCFLLLVRRMLLYMSCLIYFFHMFRFLGWIGLIRLVLLRHLFLSIFWLFWIFCIWNLLLLCLMLFLLVSIFRQSIYYFLIFKYFQDFLYIVCILKFSFFTNKLNFYIKTVVIFIGLYQLNSKYMYLHLIDIKQFTNFQKGFNI